jgi:phenylacetate-CoA ligase
MEPGFKNALRSFHNAARAIPAYKDFLRAHHITPGLVRTYADFAQVPVMGKKEYLYRYPVHDLFPGKKIPPMVYASSGSSGHPTFWFRGDDQELAGGYIHETIFTDIFGIDKESETLVVVCFSMGIWVAGNYTLASCRRLSAMGYAISTVTPGIEMEDILTVLKKLAPQFKHVILAGYPPFLMDVVTAARKEKISLPANTKFITAGDKFTEEWRDTFLGLVDAEDPLRSIISIYGSADAGVLGYETPVAIMLRREANRSPAFRTALFGEEAILPALVQYDPATIFFEEKDGELLFTANTGTPLIRYNIHDIGTIVSWEEMNALAKKFKIRGDMQAGGSSEKKLPFIIKKGRNDVAVTFYALNIYPENIKAGLTDKHIKHLVSGQFFAFNKDVTRNKKQKLCFNIELAQGVRLNATIQRAIEKAIMENLIATNIEYRKLTSAIGKSAIPQVTLFTYGGNRFHRERMPGLIGFAGKKIKIANPA